MAAGDILSLTLFSTLDGQTLNNVLHFIDSGGAGDVNNLMSEANTWLASTAVRGMFSASLTFQKWRAQVLYPNLLDPVEVATTQPAGTAGAACLPGTVAVVCSMRTGFASRSTRGRIYFPGVPEEYTTVGKLNTSGQTGWNGVTAAMLALWSSDTGTSQFHIGVWSRKIAGPHPPYNPGGFKPASSITPQPVLGTQRRRRIGVGS